ncbi:MAG: RNA-binding transcriptional accessory protein [Bacteroidia bacterium]|nr:RNA-binding transcriptional accessory protein [Bacteroidia bacterium]
MFVDYSFVIAKELNIGRNQVQAVLKLLEEGATIPFMARYRKEVTGSLDEVQLAGIRDRYSQLFQLNKRREAILESLEERGLLTDSLKSEINNALSLTELEDLYLPYRPKRRTRATIAKEKGLEPLATAIFDQKNIHPESLASTYINPEKGVLSVEEALSGARDIMAEWISENINARSRLRILFSQKSEISCKVLRGKESEGEKYQDYFDWHEPFSKVPSHRLLAMRRGENEGFLSMSIEPQEEDAVAVLERIFVKARNEASEEVKKAIKEGYKRLLSPSMETEMRVFSKDKADEEAIKVFADNMRQLLMAAPLGQKRVMAIDPGFRTGCKVVCLNEQGKLLQDEVIYPHPPKEDKQKSEHKILSLVQQFSIEAIAVGNGTAGRETEAFLRNIPALKSVLIIQVNESGASVYSASDVAREEFPDYDITVRGAVSIGRRLMDPLAELVKIDPKSIGVGQYQHDVNQTQLKQSLDDTVMSCVNAVGVEVNTASKELLTYVSGLGPVLATNIIRYRNEHGPFKTRNELKKVGRLGDKAFEQCAGFLRIRDAKNPLDSSGVHPESYSIVEKMAADLGVYLPQLIQDKALQKKIVLQKYITHTIGLPTLQDIVNELAKPGRDPREQFEMFSFTDGIHSMEDLKEGMSLNGIVTNITDFGAFVDIGVHQDGLVHLSQMANRYIKHPSEVVKVHQKVKVKVVSVDVSRKRIALTMKT